MTGNTPPYSLDAEQSVLGAITLSHGSDQVSKCLRMLSANDFYHRAHQVIFSLMVGMDSSSKAIDLITLTDLAESKGLIDDIGGFAYPAEIAKSATSSINILSYAKIVKMRSTQRQVLSAISASYEAVLKSDADTPKAIVDLALAPIEMMHERVSSNRDRGLVPMTSILSRVTEEFEQRMEGNAKGLTIGIREVDDLLAPKGVVKNGLFVIGARPKQGKTSTVLKIMEHVAVDLNKTAAFFSLEMKDTEIGEKMICQYSGVQTSALYSKRGMSETDWGLVGNAMSNLATDNIMISDTPAQTVRDIVTECRKLKRQRGEIGMIAVDYLTLMKTEKADRNDLAYGAITKELKNLAKELDTPVFLLIQLNRSLEMRADKTPVPSDGRDTGQIEQDCDYWMGIYRDETYHPDSQYKGTIQYGIELNRHGKTDRCLAGFVNGRVVDLAKGFSVPEPQSKAGKKDF